MRRNHSPTDPADHVVIEPLRLPLRDASFLNRLAGQDENVEVVLRIHVPRSRLALWTREGSLNYGHLVDSSVVHHVIAIPSSNRATSCHLDWSENCPGTTDEEYLVVVFVLTDELQVYATHNPNIIFVELPFVTAQTSHALAREAIRVFGLAQGLTHIFQMDDHFRYAGQYFGSQSLRHVSILDLLRHMEAGAASQYAADHRVIGIGPRLKRRERAPADEIVGSRDEAQRWWNSNPNGLFLLNLRLSDQFNLRFRARGSNDRHRMQTDGPAEDLNFWDDARQHGLQCLRSKIFTLFVNPTGKSSHSNASSSSFPSEASEHNRSDDIVDHLDSELSRLSLDSIDPRSPFFSTASSSSTTLRSPAVIEQREGPSGPVRGVRRRNERVEILVGNAGRDLVWQETLASYDEARRWQLVAGSHFSGPFESDSEYSSNI
ncbi:hypothetical protein HKX48_007466 [Thoreauomyces humboldtii]|nr:hypothetical protein HKX48_007466 [Thoreauomyces humboldtii]